ncbi:MAG TPA: lytic transglycosylase domain-containing protein [Solirubrobacteraceae bacterium]|nr:lytic transglycosylase domain-containing protein [Solirubrobacteraceae bacterium]
MSPQTVTAARKRSSRRPSAAARRAARRRRRTVLALVVVALVVVAAVMVLPLARKAVNELGLPLRYQSVITTQAAEKHLDPAFIAAVIYAETKFDPRTSSAGAVGPMQILPETAQFLARKSGATTFKTSDLSDPAVNIAYGSYLLRYLLDHYHGNKVDAVAAYNAGPANVDKWVAQARANGHALRAHDIPFPETRAYVERVLQAQKDYRRTYASELGYD